MFKQLTGAVRRLFSPSTGQPVTVRQEELQQPQARASVVSVRPPSPGISVASTLSPGRLAGILRGAADGNARDFFIMAEELEERDLHYASVLRTRKLTVAGIEPSVEAASDDTRDVDIADAVRNLITQPQIPELLFDLLDGLGKGVSVCEILWDTGSQFWQPRDYEWVDPRFLKPDRETLRNFHLLTDASPIEGEPLRPGKYVVHQPRLKSGLPLRNGLARLVAVMYMLKSYTVRDWWAFAEKFGIPVVVGKYGNNASPEQIQTLLDAIASLASDAGCAIPASMMLEMQETASRNNGGALFKEMAVWCDEQISKAVLGQTMTTDNGSSRSQADVHDRVRMDIARWDARQLENTLNEFGSARNDWLISCIGTNISPEPVWLWAASYGGTAAYQLAIDPARPLQTLVLTGIKPPARAVRWDVPERNLLLHDGIATHYVDAGDNVCIEREITMYRVNRFGDTDISWLDVQSPATLGRIRYVIRNRFTSRYPRHKLAGDDVLDLLDAGQPVMTPKLCRAELLDITLTELIPAGLVEDFDDYKDTLDVKIDAKDPNRLNFICHPNLVNQLRVLAGLIQFKL